MESASFYFGGLGMQMRFQIKDSQLSCKHVKYVCEIHEVASWTDSELGEGYGTGDSGRLSRSHG